MQFSKLVFKSISVLIQLLSYERQTDRERERERGGEEERVIVNHV